MALPEIVSAAEEEVISLRIHRGFAGNDFFFLRGERDFERFGNAKRNFFLNREDVFHVTIVALGPYRMARGAFDKLRGDAQAVSGAANRAFEYVHGAEFLADFWSGDRLIAEL